MTKDSVLVTGGTGFVGAHLLTALKRAFPEASIHVTGRAVQEGLSQGCVWYNLDICDRGAVRHLVQQIAPSVVIHLAAQSSVPVGFKQPDLTWQVNLEGARNLFQALEQLSYPVLLLQVGSADMYGASFNLAGPVDELRILQPLNPYAASKAAADLAAFQLAQTSAVKVIRARPFNHIGAGQSDAFVVSSFARQIVEVEMGVSDSLLVGDLTAERDFMHVSDVAAAYIALIQHHEQFETGAAVNICSGVSVSIASMLEELRRLSVIDIRVVQDPERMRKSDIARVWGSHAYLSAQTGWMPAVDLRHALGDVLDDWRERLMV